MEPDVITLGGRRFVSYGTDLTVGQHLHYDRLVMAAGLRDITRGPGESEKAFESRLLAKMLEHEDTVLELIGIFWIPEGKEPKHWTPKMARETAQILATAPGEENLALVHKLFATAYLDFFAHGLNSSPSTTSYSDVGQPYEDMVNIVLEAQRADLEETATGNGESSSVN